MSSVLHFIYQARVVASREVGTFTLSPTAFNRAVKLVQQLSNSPLLALWSTRCKITSGKQSAALFQWGLPRLLYRNKKLKLSSVIWHETVSQNRFCSLEKAEFQALFLPGGRLHGWVRLCNDSWNLHKLPWALTGRTGEAEITLAKASSQTQYSEIPPPRHCPYSEDTPECSLQAVYGCFSQ